MTSAEIARKIKRHGGWAALWRRLYGGETYASIAAELGCTRTRLYHLSTKADGWPTRGELEPWDLGSVDQAFERVLARIYKLEQEVERLKAVKK